MNSAHIEDVSDVLGSCRGEGEVLEYPWVRYSGGSGQAVSKGGGHGPAALLSRDLILTSCSGRGIAGEGISPSCDIINGIVETKLSIEASTSADKCQGSINSFSYDSLSLLSHILGLARTSLRSGSI